MKRLQKIIWTCWFQGRPQAPPLVRKCLESWERRNPGWDFRCLDADSISRYIDLSAYVDLRKQTITAASLSDILRLLLLNEFGGVWVDATTYCNEPLDAWLPSVASGGFFAFARPAPDRELATWFLAARCGDPLLGKWAARAVDYWRGRVRTNDYFWAHHEFGELCARDPEARREWEHTPRISADGPHALQNIGMDSAFEVARNHIDWMTPVFKLTHRFDADRLAPGSLAGRLLGLPDATEPAEAPALTSPDHPPLPIRVLSAAPRGPCSRVHDLAARALLRRAGLEPSAAVAGIDAANPPREDCGGVLIAGEFGAAASPWPTRPACKAVYLGFQIAGLSSPHFLSEPLLAHYAANAPIGCGDAMTQALLLSHGIDAFLSHDLSLALPRRLCRPTEQTEMFVISRDAAITDSIPALRERRSVIVTLSDDEDGAEGGAKAEAQLDALRQRAGLIVTTIPGWAWIAAALGIRVIVFFPTYHAIGDPEGAQRFAALRDLLPVFHAHEAALVDWRGYAPDVSEMKLQLVDRFFSAASRWGHLAPPRTDGIAPPSALPVPTIEPTTDIPPPLKAPRRVRRLATIRGILGNIVRRSGN